MKLKALIEKRNTLLDKMDGFVNCAETENRAMNADELAQFDDAEKEIQEIDETINRELRARNLDRTTAPVGTENRAAEEEKAFADYILGRAAELRAGEQNMTMGNNTALVPTTIANRVIKAVKDVCPILRGATLYSVKGNLKVPVWGKANETHDIAVGYQTEFEEITADAGRFTSVELGGYLAGALVLIGRSIENNGAFSVVDFIVALVAEEIAAWLEGQLLNGTGNSAAQGALNTTNTMEAAGAAAITADELITLQAMVKQAHQKDACWTMHPDTFVLIKKLKDGNNRYLLQDDVTGEFPYRLLGKPVHLSDNMPKAEAGRKAVLYGQYKGLSVNFRENITVEVLRERFATQHAIGVIAWFEFDAKITDNAQLATLTMKSGT